MESNLYEQLNTAATELQKAVSDLLNPPPGKSLNDLLEQVERANGNLYAIQQAHQTVKEMV